MRDLLDAPEPEWRRNGPRSRPRAGAPGCWPSRTRTGSGRAARSCPRGFGWSEWEARASRGPRPPWSLTQLREFGLDPASDRAAGRRADRRQLALGPRRPAVLGGRGRGVHQRPHRRRRRVLRGRRLAHRRAARGRAPGRRRLELRARARLGPLVVRQHDQRARRAARVRARHRRHARVRSRRAARARSTCSNATCSAVSARVSPPTSGSSPSCTRTAGTTTCCGRSTISAPPRAARRPTRASTRRSSTCAPAARDDGTWALDRTLPGRVWFDVDDGPGRPSRWVTLRAMRVLKWHRG